MTADDALPPITPPAISAILLADLDEFLRSGPIIADDLASYLASRGHTHPRFAADNITGDVSFTVDHLWTITNGAGKTAAEYGHLADYFRRRLSARQLIPRLPPRAIGGKPSRSASPGLSTAREKSGRFRCGGSAQWAHERCRSWWRPVARRGPAARHS